MKSLRIHPLGLEKQFVKPKKKIDEDMEIEVSSDEEIDVDIEKFMEKCIYAKPNEMVVSESSLKNDSTIVETSGLFLDYVYSIVLMEKGYEGKVLINTGHSILSLKDEDIESTFGLVSSKILNSEIPCLNFIKRDEKIEIIVVREEVDRCKKCCERIIKVLVACKNKIFKSCVVMLDKQRRIYNKNIQSGMAFVRGLDGERQVVFIGK